MIYLLDTNVVSELRRPDRADANVLAFAASHPLERFCLSVVTILEIELGVIAQERRDPAQGASLRRWCETQVLARFDARILPFDLKAARLCARLHVPDRLPERDAMIAATAITRGLVLVTRNTKDFAATGAQLLDPWR